MMLVADLFESVDNLAGELLGDCDVGRAFVCHAVRVEGPNFTPATSSRPNRRGPVAEGWDPHGVPPEGPTVADPL